MFSNFSVSTKCKSHFCDHTELWNFVLGKYLLTAVCWMGNCLSSEHYAWIICLLLLLASSAEYHFTLWIIEQLVVLHFSSYWKKNEEPVNLLKSMKLKTQGKYLFCKQKFKANNSDNSANKYYQVSNTFCVPMH